MSRSCYALLGSMLVVGLATPSQAVLVAHYTFDTGGGATVGTDATLGGAATIDNTNYLVGTGSLALSANPGTDTAGDDGAVSGNDFDWSTSTIRTVAFYMKAPSTQPDPNPTMISLGSGSGAGNRFDIRLASGNLRLEVQSGGFTTDSLLADDDWHHVAVVVASDPATVSSTEYYVDGVFAGNFSHTRELATGLGPLRMGDSYQDTGRDFLGNLDDVRLYDTALTPMEIADLASAVTATPQLAVEVNRQTGNITISNPFPAPQTFVGYSLTSATGALNSDNGVWTSIADSGTPDDDWFEFTAAGDRQNIGEAEQPGGTGVTLGQNESVDLGNVWIQNPDEDLVLQVLGPSGPAEFSLRFTGDPIPGGDLNFDGMFDENDWPTLRDNLYSDLAGLSPAEQYQMGDLNEDGLSNEDDFLVFESQYDAMYGGGAFAAMVAATAVPEPNSVGLMALCGMFYWWLRGGRRLQRAFAAIPVLLVAAMLSTGQSASALEVLSSNFDAHGSIDGATEFTGITWTTNGVSDPGSTIALSSPATVQTGGAAANLDRLAVAQNIDTAGPWNIDLTFDATSPGIQLDYLQFDYQFISGGGANQLGAHPDSGIVDVSILDSGLNELSAVQIGPLGTADAASNVGVGIVADFPNVSLTSGSTYTLRFNVSSNATSGNNFALDNLSLNAPDPELSLVVNTNTGIAQIVNATAGPIQFNFYKLTSATDSLDVAGWNSLYDQDMVDFPAGDGLGSGWEEAGGSNNGELGEFYLSGDSVLAAGASVNLGGVFQQGTGSEDIMLRYRDTNSNRYIDVAATYIDEVLGGDYNGDGTVDIADYTVWRNNLGASVALMGENPSATTPGVVDAEDYAYWKSQFGAISGSGSPAAVAAVPEPAAWTLLLAGGLLLMKRSRPLLTVGLTLMLMPSIVLASTADRLYQFGDDPLEDSANATNDLVGSGPGNAVANSSLDSIGPDSDLENYADLLVHGDPKYVRTDLMGRPGASTGELGAEFLGTGDYLDGFNLNGPLNSTSAATQNGDRNYADIYDRGMQFWAFPYSSGDGAEQSLVADSPQHAVRINAAGQWVMQYGGTQYESNADVAYDSWSHVMLVRPFGSAAGARLYIDGIAVTAGGTSYANADATPLVIGSISGDNAGTADYYQGVLDNLEMFVIGTASADPFDEYGDFNLATDNEFVTSALANATPGDLTGDGLVMGNGSGGANDDVAAFIANWQKRQVINGLSVGDLNTYADGDFNMDGVVDLYDWDVIRTNHTNAGALNLGALLAGRQVPEPSTAVLLVAGLLVGAIRCRPKR
ncbi:LamG domain-containing protein [Aeoliella sp. ICT_H6.2]|uniref:LamG domain-containing protein n=1 Tax=Aeoliella straminimaris TaxID=2954799 RepID=A0A9X2F952_9BACT|nr:LamG domain-containing protein [Aeoliella straminimaris]MCO6044660.1 LamG domain-containing protein [Aeoliella straminimaris]